MNKGLQIICAVVALVCIDNAQSQAFYAYKENGAVMQLTVQDSIISLKPAQGRIQWTGLFETEQALNSAVEPEEIADGFFLF